MGTSIKFPKETKTSVGWEVRGGVSPVSNTGTRSVGRGGGFKLSITRRIYSSVSALLGSFFPGGGNKSVFQCPVFVCLSS